jgi:hypothetical protein
MCRLLIPYASQTCETIRARATKKRKVSTDLDKFTVPIRLYFVPHFPRGTDLAPPGGQGSSRGAGLATEAIPKSVARVLDAAKIRAGYRQKRARLEADANNDHGPTSKKRRTGPPAASVGKRAKGKEKGREGATTIEIQPWESLKAFHQCVVHFFSIIVKKWRVRHTLF